MGKAGEATDYELKIEYIIPGKHHEEIKREEGQRMCVQDNHGFYVSFYYYFYLRGFSPKENKEMGATEHYRRIFIDGSNNWCKDQSFVELEMFEGLKGPCD